MALVVVLAFGGLTIMAAWLSVIFFLLGNTKVKERVARPHALPTYWKQSQEDPRQHKRLLTAMALSFGLAYVGVPVAVAAGQRQQRPVHGDARFATAGEVMRSGLIGNQGLIVGKYKGEYLRLDEDIHVMCPAPSGTGKGTSLLLPNLLAYDGSAVVYDPKNEAEDLSSGWRAECGQKVYTFAPYHREGRTHRYNPLSYISDDPALRVSDLMNLGHMIWPHDDKSEGSSSNFFNNNARDLFMALGLYLMETPETEMPRTLGQLLRLAGSDGRPLRQYLMSFIADREQQKRPLSYQCRAAFLRVLGAPDETLGGIVATLTGSLLPFSDPLVDAATSASDFDLCELRRQRMTIYLVLPFDKQRQGRLVMNLFLTQAIQLNVQEEPKNNEALRHECTFFMDEFTAPGRIPIVAEGSGFIRSYGIRLFVLFQSMGALTGEYTPHIARMMQANHRCRVLFAPSEQEDANEQSEMLGTQTVRVSSRSHTSSTSGGSTGTNETQQERALMLAQELRMLDPEQQIVVMEGERPILCHKARYYDDPELEGRIRPKVQVPSINPALYMAQVSRAWRYVQPQECLAGIELERLDHDVQALPPAPTDDADFEEQADRYVDSYFAHMAPPEEDRDGPGEDEAVAGEDANSIEEAEAPAPAPQARKRKPRSHPKRADAPDAAAPPASRAQEPPDPWGDGEVDLSRLDQ
jgi:type IV secretion system protein VirD4